MYGCLTSKVLGMGPGISSMLGTCFTKELKPPKGILEFSNVCGFGSSKYVISIIFVNDLYFEAETTA